jgi:hypothetical protein
MRLDENGFKNYTREGLKLKSIYTKGNTLFNGNTFILDGTKVTMKDSLNFKKKKP